jgi:predicted enzyme related to lactoylglutathione lyase
MDMNEIFLKPGAVSWTELTTSDVEAAKKFYSTLFGWTFQRAPNVEMQYDIISVGDRPFGGIFKTPKEMGSMPPVWRDYVTVENVDETAKNAEELGAKILMPPTDIPQVGRFCIFQDPQGAVLAVISYI